MIHIQQKYGDNDNIQPHNTYCTSDNTFPLSFNLPNLMELFQFKMRPQRRTFADCCSRLDAISTAQATHHNMEGRAELITRIKNETCTDEN